MAIQSVNAYASSAASQLLPQSTPASSSAANDRKRTLAPLDIRPPTPMELESAVERVAGALQTRASELRFAIDSDSGKAIVRITDQKTGEMIRQIPSVELMEIARSLDRMQGLLFSQKA